MAIVMNEFKMIALKMLKLPQQTRLCIFRNPKTREKVFLLTQGIKLLRTNTKLDVIHMKTVFKILHQSKQVLIITYNNVILHKDC